MIQRPYFPQNPKIRQYINCMAYVELSAGEAPANWVAIFPEAKSHLIISLSDENLSFNKASGSSLLFTSCGKTIAQKCSSSMRFLHMEFKPFGIHYLTGIPMGELRDSYLTMDLIFSASECSFIRDRLKSAKSIASRFFIMEKFLEDRFKIDKPDNRIHHSISLIKHHYQLSLDELSNEVCLSPRGLRKLFTNKVGISPGQFKKLVRFNNAANQMVNQPEATLTSIAYLNGYSDQSHFIKDFRTFSGITPSEFKLKKSPSSVFYNYALENLDRFDP